MGADTKDLEEWIADLDKADEELLPRAERIVGRGCYQIKQQWKGMWTGYPHIPYLPNAINYDVHRDGDEIFGEVGVDRTKPQGPLGGIIAYGQGDNGPLPGPLEAIAAEEPKFQRALADLLEELLAGRG